MEWEESEKFCVFQLSNGWFTILHLVSGVQHVGSKLL